MKVVARSMADNTRISTVGSILGIGDPTRDVSLRTARGWDIMMQRIHSSISPAIVRSSSSDLWKRFSRALSVHSMAVSAWSFQVTSGVCYARVDTKGHSAGRRLRSRRNGSVKALCSQIGSISSDSVLEIFFFNIILPSQLVERCKPHLSWEREG